MTTPNEVIVMFRNDNKGMLHIFKNFSSVNRMYPDLVYDQSTFQNDQIRGTITGGKEVYFEIHDIFDEETIS